MAIPGVVTGRWKPLGRMVEPDVGPEEASLQPLRFVSGIWMLLGGLARVVACFSLSNVSLVAASLLISSSIRLLNKYRNTHLPIFTAQCEHLSYSTKYKGGHTSLIFAELNLVLQLYLISIHLGIEAILFFQHASQTPSPCIDCAPV